MSIVLWYQNKAIAIERNDCEATDIVATTITKWFENIYPHEAAKKAIDNLITYCCEKKLGKISKDICDKVPVTQQKWPESAFLYDHLIDVGLRRLNGIKKDAYNLEKMDLKGVERRTWIQDQAKKTDGVTAKVISDEYKKFRTLTPRANLTEKTVKDYEKIYNTNEVSLADKYNNLCRIALQMNNRTVTNVSTRNYKDCQKMVSNRMNKEDLFVRTLLIQKSNKQLIDSMRNTTDKQFTQNKLMPLQTAIGQMKDLFFTRTKQAPVCKNCQN